MVLVFALKIRNDLYIPYKDSDTAIFLYSKLTNILENLERNDWCIYAYFKTFENLLRFEYPL